MKPIPLYLVRSPVGERLTLSSFVPKQETSDPQTYPRYWVFRGEEDDFTIELTPEDQRKLLRKLGGRLELGDCVNLSTGEVTRWKYPDVDPNDSVTVVGFEGCLDRLFTVAWGAAAIQVGDRLVNPTTWRSTPFTEFPKLVTAGWLTRLEPLEVRGIRTDPSIVVVVNQNAAWVSYFTQALSFRMWSGHLVTVVRNAEEFARYQRETVSKVVEGLLRISDLDARKDLASTALELAPHDPELNAFQVHLTAGQRREQLARACVRGTQDLAVFDRCLESLRTSDTWTRPGLGEDA